MQNKKIKKKSKEKRYNRHFRYEERDKEGIVKGHYGFYDKEGKLRMINYDSSPKNGFHAEGNFGSKLDNLPVTP